MDDARSRRAARLRRQVLGWVAAVALSACGGGGGGSGEPAGGPPPPAGPPASSGFAVPAALAQGTTFEFVVNADASAIAQGSGSTSNSDYGTFKIALGAPVTLGGRAMFPITISGDPEVGGRDYTPPWRFVGTEGGAWYGSRDGTTVEPLYSPSGGSTPGFFGLLDVRRAHTLQNQRFAGTYNQFDAFALQDAASEGGCEIVLGGTVCHDERTEYSLVEYFKAGLGPIGLRLSTAYESSGGGFTTVFRSATVVELVRTTLAAADGVALKPPPWEELAPMRLNREGPAVAAYDGKLYVFGGRTYPTAAGAPTTETSSEIYDPATDTWTAGPPLPVPMFGARAVVHAQYAYVGSGTQVYRLDFTTGTWGAVSLPAGVTVNHLSLWLSPSGPRLVIVTHAPSLPHTFTVRSMSVASAADLTEHVSTTFNGSAYMAVMLEHRLIVIGGHERRDGGTFYRLVRPYNLLTNLRESDLASTRTPHTEAAAAVFQGRVHVIGGRHAAGESRDAEVYDATANTWSDAPAMLRPRYAVGEAVIGDALYVVGGVRSAGLMRYRPVP